MMRFDEDYGTLWSTEALFRPVSNLTELWWDGEMQALLNLHLTNAPKETLASDYDRFRFLCERMPALALHPVARHCKALLRRHFACEEQMNRDSCADIWHRCADALLSKPLSVADLLAETETTTHLLWERGELPECFPRGIIPEVTHKSLMPHEPIAWQAWLTQCEETLDRFSAYDCRRVYVELDEEFVFCEPDPYHVAQAAARARRQTEDRNLLTAQLLRFLSETCQKRGWKIHLSVGDSGREATRLLAYAERTVGLAPILWSTADPSAREAMVQFSQLPHQASVLPVIRACDHPSDTELASAFLYYAARYPVDLISFVSGGDLRHKTAERERMDRLLSSYKL